MESKEHNDAVNKICNLFSANPIKIIGNKNIAGFYFADASTKTMDFEIETVPRRSYILNKSRKWVRVRKRALILTLFKDVKDLFDEIYVLKDEDLIRLK